MAEKTLAAKLNANPPIGVVIPYFQREAGILVRALKSVARQIGVTHVRVVVVDDTSPVPAESELTGLKKRFPFDLELVLQPNGGPGAARNRGLAALPNDVQYVAFLDSDDEWSDDHLQRATFTLQQGFDVYFADHLQLGADVSAFRRAGRIAPEHHLLIEGASDLHAYSGSMFDQILTGNVIGTSTVAYDRKAFSKTTFRPEYRNAGEDYLFWIDLALAGAKFAFSTQCEATYGRGVNVYSGAGWGTPEHFLRLHYEMKYRKVLLREFGLSNAQRIKMIAAVSELRLSMARDLLHRVKLRRPLPLAWAEAQARLDPLTYASLPLNCMRLIAEAITGRSNPS